MNNNSTDNIITAIDNLTLTGTDPVVIEAPAVPEVNLEELQTPADLLPLHRQLVERATVLAGRDGDTTYGNGQADNWLRAATQVHALRDMWAHRMHATAAHEAMRTNAVQAVTALLTALGTNRRREQDRWFGIASEWANDLRMQADPGHLVASAVPASVRPQRTSNQPGNPLTQFTNRLFGHRRASTVDSKPTGS